MATDPLGWLITVQLPDGSTPQVYNVAIPNEREAIDAVKKVVPQAKGVVIKVKSELFERVYKALKMRPGDVLAGAQRRTKAKRASSV
jgi:hypothetical protein